MARGPGLRGGAQAPAVITYIYDELGRLVAVVDPATDTARYTYDSVGNILSISRQSSALVSVLQVRPGSGPVGASVTIWGTGFSSTPGQNSVTFNGTTATVTSATSTQLVTTVPAGATTGSIVVMAPGGNASSPTPFTVASAGAPTIGAAGTALTITGANFETALAHNKAALNGALIPLTVATATTLQGTVPQAAGSGRISVSTPEGSVTSTADFIVPPPPYTAADVAVTDRMTIGGANKTVTLTSAYTVALVLFDATGGQRVNLGLTGITIGTNPFYYTVVKVYKLDGTLLASVEVGANGGDIDTGPLPTTGR